MIITPTIGIGSSKLNITTPANIPIVSPGFQYWIIANGTGGQFAGLNLPPVSFSPSDQGQLIDLTLVDAANNSVKLSSLNPPVTSLQNGQIYLQATSGALSQSVTIKGQIMGRQADRTGYVVFSVTNNGGSALSLKSAIASFLNTHFCSSRSYGIDATTGDQYALDATNKIVQLTNTGVSNIVTGFTSNYGAFSSVTQHHQIVDTTINEVTQITGSGALADTISGSATATKGVYIAIGDTTNRISIPAGATAQFVFMLGASDTLPHLTTLLNAAKSGYATDITAFQAFSAQPHMSLSTPHVYLDIALEFILMHEYFKGKFQKSSNGYQFNPAGSYTYFSCFARDGYYGKMAMSQMGDTANVQDEYLLQKSTQFGNFTQCHEIIDSFQTSGFRQDASNNGVPGDEEPYVILKAYEYYIRTLDATFLSNELGNLNGIANYIKTWYDTNVNGKTSDNLITANCNATYLDSGGCQIGGQTYVADPVYVATVIYAMRAIVELNTAAGNLGNATLYNTFKNTLISNMPALWVNAKNWLAFNKSIDGTTTVNNPHLMKVDALVFDALADTAKQQSMLSVLAGSGSIFWNDASDVAGFQMFPTADSLFSGLGVGWYGPPWNIGDGKAFHAIFRYGNNTQAQWGFDKLKKYCQRLIYNNVYSPAEYYGNIGQFEFSSGSFVEMIIKGLFGIDAHAAYFTVNPNIPKLSQGGVWKLNNLVMGGSTFNVTVTGIGDNVNVKVDGVTQSGNIAYPAAGTHTLAITCGGRSSN